MIDSLVGNSPKFSDYPDAGAVVLFEQIVIEINSDGSSTTNGYFLVKILRDRGKTEFGDMKRNYNRKTDSMVVMVAQSRKRIGKPMPVAQEAINDITPPELAGASIYADFHQKVISFPDVAPNVCLELKYRIFRKADPQGNPYFWGSTSFQGEEPILAKEYVLILPRDMKISHALTKGTLAPSVRSREDKTVYVWKARNIPQIIPEPYMPPDTAPLLCVSSCPGWADLGKWLHGRFSEKVRLTDAIRAKAAELTLGLTSIDEKVRAVSLWLITRVRNISVPLGITGYEPNPVDTVLANRYGDSRDKAALLASLIEAVGARARFALVNRDASTVLPEIPTPRPFNAVFVLADVAPGRTLWIDPFAEDCRWGYFSIENPGSALIASSEGGTLVQAPTFGPEINATKVEGNVSLSSDGSVAVDETFRLDGIADQGMRDALKDLTPKEIDRFYDQSATAIGEGTKIVRREMSDLEDLTALAGISWSYTSPDQGVAEEDMMIFHLPALAFGFVDAVPFQPSLKERKYPFRITQDCSYESQYRIKIPADYEIAAMPDGMNVKNEFGQWTLSFVRDPADPSLVIKTKSMSVTARTVSLEQYDSYKKTVDDFVHRRHGVILLKKKTNK
jgi:transglutaminase-like putative cysteine protease